ncbi:MAG: S-layer homology domain-containing protein [Oscillospiraceae bacterium]|jgi:hypothetical protein|nr:S-layer homology domain-containing protein [Oscillospiraceae bacterium]
MAGITELDISSKGIAGLSGVGYFTAPDVSNNTAVDAIKKLRGVSPGVMSGKSADTFDPDGKFTREESVSTMVKLWDFVQK